MHRRSTRRGLSAGEGTGQLVAGEGTWTFQVAPEAGWARRSGPVTLRARLMPTGARPARRRRVAPPLRTHAASQLQSTCVLIPLIKITMLENCTDDASVERGSQGRMINDYGDYGCSWPAIRNVLNL